MPDHNLRFIICQSGSTAVLFAVTCAMLLLTVGGAVDYMRLVSMKSDMQSVADGAAIMSARAITVAQTDEASIKAIATNYVQAYADGNISNSTVEVDVDLDRRRVELKMTLQPNTDFQTPFVGKVLNTTSTAEVIGQMPLCVLGLDSDSQETLDLNANSLLTGIDCAVYSNSKSPRGISVDAGGTLSAGMVCTAGGGSGDISPSLTKDCPPLDDPLSGRAQPDASTCTYTDKALGIDRSQLTTENGQWRLITMDTAGEQSGVNRDIAQPTLDLDSTQRQVVVLSPGVYCGGLLIGGGYDVELEPGIYVMKDGPLFVDGTVRLHGSHVGVYFSGEGSTLFVGSGTSIHLTAPTDGILAGLLFYQDRSNEVGQRFAILSDDAHVLTGTIYLPVGDLIVDSDEAIADQSAYTAIVARRLTLFTGPRLVLNSDYDATDVPAAVGVDYNRTVRLLN